MNALMIQNNYAVFVFNEFLKKYSNVPKDKMSSYPELQNAYNNAMTAMQKVNATGFQEIPKEQYLQWLKSVEIEKEKQKSKK